MVAHSKLEVHLVARNCLAPKLGMGVEDIVERDRLGVGLHVGHCPWCMIGGGLGELKILLVWFSSDPLFAHLLAARLSW